VRIMHYSLLIAETGIRRFEICYRLRENRDVQYGRGLGRCSHKSVFSMRNWWRIPHRAKKQRGLPLYVPSVKMADRHRRANPLRLYRIPWRDDGKQRRARRSEAKCLTSDGAGKLFTRANDG
jgi:hypothetical protein